MGYVSFREGIGSCYYSDASDVFLLSLMNIMLSKWLNRSSSSFVTENS